MGWRDITNATNERTVIASVIPRAGCGDTLLLMFPICDDSRKVACLLADQNSLVHDYIARQKIGGTHLKYHVKKQITTLPPSAYSESDLAFIVPRVLELTYTSEEMAGWAKDLGHHRPPFAFNPDRRALLRAELDAWYARLYGLTRKELQYILDPSTTHGPNYPTVTFPGLRKKEMERYGEYRTQRLVLEAWDRQASAAAAPSWQDRKFDLLAPNRRPLPDYRALVWPELLRQLTGDVEFDLFRKAYWLLSEPDTLAKVGRTALPDVPDAWWSSRTECLAKSDFLGALKGTAMMRHIQIRSTGGIRYIHWIGPAATDATPPFPEALDDARVALMVAQQWLDDVAPAEKASMESELLTLEKA